MTVRVVRERIDPRLTASLFANYRSAIDAVLELGYVRIEIGEVDRKVDARRLPARLAEVYRPLLAGDVAITINREPVPPIEWPVVERHEFTVRGGGRLVRGWYGLLADPPPPSLESGVRIYHLGRLVGPPDWFGHPGPAVHLALNRLIGEVELPHVPVTMNKSDVDHDSPEWLAAEERLHRLLTPVIRRLMREEGSAVAPGALRTADQVRRILARALRLLESGKLFESDAGTGIGEGRDGQLTLAAARPFDDEPGPTDEVDANHGTTIEPDDARPARPPRPAGSGAGRGIGEVVVRALDPRLRSAMVVEDGVRRVVINSRYPLYEVRKGDLWYQLETALREVCVTIPEATVPEFERKVNELMVVSLSLTGRRRRPARPAGRAVKGAWTRG